MRKLLGKASAHGTQIKRKWSTTQENIKPWEVETENNRTNYCSARKVQTRGNGGADNPKLVIIEAYGSRRYQESQEGPPRRTGDEGFQEQRKSSREGHSASGQLRTHTGHCFTQCSRTGQESCQHRFAERGGKNNKRTHLD